MALTFLGIDIGAASGAFALINSNFKVLELHDFKNFYHFYELITKTPEIHLTAIEDVYIWPGSGAAASTNFMKNAGGYEAILEILRLPRKIVRPQKWQKAILGDISRPATKGLEKKAADKIKREHKKLLKQTSINKANQMFGLHLESDGQADALNLAYYALKVFRGEVLHV